ncbi:MAG: Gldg family protein [Kiritimatiellae bacterium]|nr:Gldg family protein [Kiritimatiellia bacterium]
MALTARHSRETDPAKAARRSLRRALWRRRRQRWSAGTHLAADLVLAAALVTLLNLLAPRLDTGWYLPGRHAALSPRARTLMASTRGVIRATALIPPSHPAFEPLRQLLRNLQNAARDADAAKLEIVHVDPYRELARAAQLARQFDVTGWAVIFESQGRREMVMADEMYEPGGPTHVTERPGAGSRRRRFLGEQLCVTAIARLARPSTPVVYALSGHGERDLEDYDPLNGYADLAREIRREGYDLRALSLPQAGDVPTDCDVLLIAGARRPPSAEERARLEAYLTRGGRLLLLSDRADVLPTGWESILDCLGLRFANVTAVGAQTLAGHAMTVDTFGAHTITRDLRNTAIYFVSPQVIDIAAPRPDASPDQPRAEIVVAAPPAAWGETNPDLTPRHFDPDVDRKGTLALVVAVERGAGTGADIGLKPLRAVVIGDSHFAVNSLLAGGRSGNRDLLLNAINWLSEGGRPTAASAPADSGTLQFGLSRRKQLRFIVRSVVLWPLSLVILGALSYAIRHR